MSVPWFFDERFEFRETAPPKRFQVLGERPELLVIRFVEVGVSLLTEIDSAKRDAEFAGNPAGRLFFAPDDLVDIVKAYLLGERRESAGPFPRRLQIRVGRQR